MNNMLWISEDTRTSAHPIRFCSDDKETLLLRLALIPRDGHKMILLEQVVEVLTRKYGEVSAPPGKERGFTDQVTGKVTLHIYPARFLA